MPLSYEASSQLGLDSRCSLHRLDGEVPRDMRLDMFAR